MYCGYITTLKNVRPHPNADRMKLADCFGNTICVGLDAIENEQVIYFPTDGQLSTEYCIQNNLIRQKDENGNVTGGYLDPDKRNIRAIKLRGEKSDGLAMPLESLNYTGIDITTFSIGDAITVVNGHEICKKYIPNSKKTHSSHAKSNKTRKRKIKIAPLFMEHADTEQLAYNLSDFRAGDEIEITLKMHGTSQRTAYLPVFQGYKRTFWDRLFRRQGTPIYDWGYVSGTRRVVLESYDGGFYGSNEFREQHSKFFEGKLWKNETVYYEVVGFTHTGTSIMPAADNKKVCDKEFLKQYGRTTVFSYGCAYENNPNEILPVSDIYVYRMTMTNEDGNIVEYSPEFMRYRCEQMGVKTVPVMWRGFIPHEDNPGEWVKAKAEKFYDGPDPIGKTHIREGVVVRIINRPKFCAYKHKNFQFKVLENIIKDVADAPDVEEAEELIREAEAENAE